MYKIMVKYYIDCKCISDGTDRGFDFKGIQSLFYSYTILGTFSQLNYYHTMTLRVKLAQSRNFHD